MGAATHRIHVQTTPGGRVVPPSQDVAVGAGSGYLMHFVPDPGHRLHDILLNGVPQGAQRQLFIPRIMSDTRVSVEYRLAHYSHLSRCTLSNLVDPEDQRKTPQYSGIAFFACVGAPNGVPCGIKVELNNGRNSLSYTWVSGEVLLTYKHHDDKVGSSYEHSSVAVADKACPQGVRLSACGSCVAASVVTTEGEIAELTAEIPSGGATNWHLFVDSWDSPESGTAGGEVELSGVTLSADGVEKSSPVRGSAMASGHRRIPALDL